MKRAAVLYSVPMVICGLTLKEEDIHILPEIGVTDSKLLSPKKRERLAIEIQNLAVEIAVKEVSPEDIDSRRASRHLPERD